MGRMILLYFFVLFCFAFLYKIPLQGTRDHYMTRFYTQQSSLVLVNLNTNNAKYLATCRSQVHNIFSSPTLSTGEMCVLLAHQSVVCHRKMLNSRF